MINNHELDNSYNFLIIFTYLVLSLFIADLFKSFSLIPSKIKQYLRKAFKCDILLK